MTHNASETAKRGADNYRGRASLNDAPTERSHGSKQSAKANAVVRRFDESGDRPDEDPPRMSIAP
jgi:hypothetical protein